MIQTQQRRKTKVLLIGIAGVLLIYWTTGILHENLINGTFKSSLTSEFEILQDKDCLILFPALATWIAGQIINSRLPKRVKIPNKNSAICASIIFISTFSYTIAAAKTSFPVVMAFKASNVLSVILVAIFFTRVQQKSLKLSPKKLYIGIIVTIGVFMFGFFDPQAKTRSKDSQFLGIGLLFISLFADGVLPDFQAQIKSEYQPQPTQMMADINKWLAIISFAYAVISFQIWQIMVFMIYHPTFSFRLILMSSLSIFGQIIIYRLIKEFKQHIVPFIVTIRKIFTIFINILVYGHQTRMLQFVGMLIVVLAVVFEFFAQIKQTKNSFTRISQDFGQISEESHLELQKNQEEEHQ